MSRLLAFSFVFVCTVFIFEQVSLGVNPESNRWTRYGYRPLAMGNAFVAVADDYNALYYNPAGLARLKDWSGDLLMFHGEVSKNTYGAVNDLMKIGQGGGSSSDSTSSNDDKTSKMIDFMEKQTGKTHHFNIGLTPNLVFPGFGFAIGEDTYLTAVIHRDIALYVDMAIVQINAPVAYAMNFFEDRLSVGAGIKFLAKGGVHREFSISDIEALSSNDNNDQATKDQNKDKWKEWTQGGTAVGVDVGMLFTPTKTLEPTLGLSIMDFGGTPYRKQAVNGSALSAPDFRPSSVNTGFSLKPWKTSDMYLRCSLDAHAINQTYQYSRKVNSGVEWGYSDWLKVQTGLYQGELTAGMELDIFLFTFRALTYAEQMGPVAGLDDNLRDRRYAVEFKLLI